MILKNLKNKKNETSTQQDQKFYPHEQTKQQENNIESINILLNFDPKESKDENLIKFKYIKQFKHKLVKKFSKANLNHDPINKELVKTILKIQFKINKISKSDSSYDIINQIDNYDKSELFVFIEKQARLRNISSLVNIYKDNQVVDLNQLNDLYNISQEFIQKVKEKEDIRVLEYKQFQNNEQLKPEYKYKSEDMINKNDLKPNQNSATQLYQKIIKNESFKLHEKKFNSSNRNNSKNIYSFSNYIKSSIQNNVKQVNNDIFSKLNIKEFKLMVENDEKELKELKNQILNYEMKFADIELDIKKSKKEIEIIDSEIKRYESKFKSNRKDKDNKINMLIDIIKMNNIEYEKRDNILQIRFNKINENHSFIDLSNEYDFSNNLMIENISNMIFYRKFPDNFDSILVICRGIENALNYLSKRTSNIGQIKLLVPYISKYNQIINIGNKNSNELFNTFKYIDNELNIKFNVSKKTDFEVSNVNTILNKFKNELDDLLQCKDCKEVDSEQTVLKQKNQCQYKIISIKDEEGKNKILKFQIKFETKEQMDQIISKIQTICKHNNSNLEILNVQDINNQIDGVKEKFSKQKFQNKIINFIGLGVYDNKNNYYNIFDDFN